MSISTNGAFYETGLGRIGGAVQPTYHLSRWASCPHQVPKDPDATF